MTGFGPQEHKNTKNLEATENVSFVRREDHGKGKRRVAGVLVVRGLNDRA